MHKEGFPGLGLGAWRECRACPALLPASGVACEEVGVAEMEFFGLKCTLKVNTATGS